MRVILRRDSVRGTEALRVDDLVLDPNHLGLTILRSGEMFKDFDYTVVDFGTGLQVRDDLHMQIDEAFREHGIEFPYPQRDLHIKEFPSGAIEPTGG